MLFPGVDTVKATIALLWSEPPKWLRYAVALLVFAVVLVLAHVWLIAPVLQNGDAAVYCEQIEQRVISVRTTHIGYILLGIAVDSILPLDVVRSLNLMSLICASIGGISITLIAKKLGASWWIASTASVLVFGLQPYLYGAVLSEVDVPACSFVLAAIAAWYHGRPVCSGVAFGVALLITPISALTLPIFLLGWSEQDPPRRQFGHPRKLVAFAAASSATYVPFVAEFWHDYWNSGRGILNAPRQPWSLIDQLSRSLEFFEHNSGIWSLLAIVGVALSLTRRQSLAWGLIVSIILTAIVRERFLDVPVQLPNLCLLAAFAVSSMARVPKRTIAGLLLCVAWIDSARVTYPQVNDAVTTRVRLRKVYLEMARQTPKLIVAGLNNSWDDGLPFEHIVYGKTKLGLGLDVKQFTSTAPMIARKHPDFAIWVASPLPSSAMAVFTRGWRRETRAVYGRYYDVLVPVSQ